MITRQTIIADIVEEYPEVISTLLDLGIHCVGCHASPYETLEDGFRGHGMSEEDVDSIVVKLNSIVTKTREEQEAKKRAEQANNNKEDSASITLSDLAVEKINEFCEKKEKKGIRLRVDVGGCSGNMYSFDLVDAPKEGDITIERNGAKLFIDKSSLDKLNGSELDYIDDLTGAGFTVKNPSAESVCGCGKSFR